MMTEEFKKHLSKVLKNKIKDIKLFMIEDKNNNKINKLIALNNNIADSNIKDISAAGIILYFEENNEKYFIVKKNKYHKYDKESRTYYVTSNKSEYGDFGGKCEVEEHPLQSAIRELYEESLGIFKLDINEVINKKVKYFDIINEKNNKNYRLYLIKIVKKNYIESFTKAYKRYNVIRNNMDNIKFKHLHLYKYDDTYTITYITSKQFINYINCCYDISGNKIIFCYRLFKFISRYKHDIKKLFLK